MKYQGKISLWNEERGFGFIKWNGADDKLFVHVSAFSEKRRNPAEGDIVTYEVGKDANGRSQALNVSFVFPAKRYLSGRSDNKFGFGRFALIGMVALIGIAGYFKHAPQELFKQTELGSVSEGRGGNESDAAISGAFTNRQSNLQVTGQGIVVKLLPDDNDGSQHQRFILRLATGQTLLVAHNIDIAPRINSLSEGGAVEFYGQYEWNEKGGVIHWTHRDPRGSHVDGWLQYQGQKYQ
jgi:cold shock CspA family protein